MELKYRDNEGDVRIWVEGGTDQEVDALAKRFDEAAQDEALADKMIGRAATPIEPLTGIDGTWGRAVSGSSNPRATIEKMGEEMECLRRELAAERRCTAAYRARLAQVASQKAAPGGWLWWPLLVLAGVGIVDMARLVAGFMGWR